DDFRRGKPSSLKVFGEAIAILAGDTLLVSGFDLIAKNAEVKEIKKQSILKVIKETSFYIGTENMLGGQVEDITLNDKDIAKEELINLYMKKTAALICLSIRAGAILSGANQKQLKALTKYGENMGLAFQIVDDMLDIMQDQRDMGKPNYANKFGMKESKNESERLIKEAKDSLKIFNHRAELLRNIADYLLTRKR
ncbi:MAG: polyprenyl synthetase family protein, partial [Candidatus Caldatribacteriota bacterium]|nr:polyprenyl synthetase family protein [Candidatus Caldatribacteriota bacterium]